MKGYGGTPFIHIQKRYGMINSVNQSKSPRHLLISEKLREQISSGQYAPGGQLPSEFDLGQQFNVSRTTVRRAIANLVNQGLVTTHRGKGVFVKERSKVVFSLSNPLTFFNTDLVRQGITGSVRNIRFERVDPPLDIATQLGLTAEGTEVYCQQKIILTNDIPTVLDMVYFPVEVGEKLSDALQQGFTYTTLDRNGFPLERAEITLESTHATPEIGRYLEVPIGAPLLLYRYVAYSQGDRPVACGEAISRADRACYSVVLTRGDLHTEDV